MRKLRAPRVHFRRSIVLLALSMLIATFATVIPLSREALAVDAIWNGDTLAYDGNTYSPVTAPPDRTGTPNEYEWRSGSAAAGTLIASVLYFGEEPQNADTATLISYPINNGTYDTTDATNPETIAVTRDLTAQPDESRNATNCAIDSVGWIVCPLSSWIANGVDWVYGIVSGFLEVQTISTSDNAIYELWKLVRNIANVVFIIVFLVIIYSQITGAGYSNYNIKDMVPKLVLGAVLVNISFWVCALAVDASNLLGYSVQAILINIRENYVEPVDIDWSTFTNLILAGGGVAGFAGFAAAAGGSASSLGFILLAALISAALSVLAAFVILAARQAIIVVLTAIAPLAFVALILPSTRGWFDKWRGLFTNMLILFPAFSLLFGASQLAGAAIIKSAESAAPEMQLALVLVGLTVQVIPLAMTPFLTRLSTGILGQIANITNNKEKGIADRAKNWAHDNADTHKARKQTNVANDLERRRNGENMGRFGAFRGRGAGGWGVHMDQKKREREAYKKLGEDTLSAMHARDWDARSNRPKGPNRVQSALGMQSRDQRTSAQRHTAHALHKQGEREKAAFEAAGEKHWAEYERSTTGQHYRNLRTQATVDKGIAEKMDVELDSADQATLAKRIADDRELTRIIKNTHHSKQQAQQYETIVQKAAEKSWNDRVRNDADTRALYLRATRNEQGADVSEQQLKTFVQEIETRGSSTPGLTQGATAQVARDLEQYASNIKTAHVEMDVSKNAEAMAQREQKIELAKEYKTNETLRMRAGGIRGEAGANLVQAQAIQTIISNQIEGTKAEKSILSQIESEEIFRRMDNPNASVEQLSAYAGTIAERGYHKDHIRMLAKISDMYHEAKLSGDQQRIDMIRDTQQQFNADQSKVAFGVSDFDRTLLGEGRYATNIFARTKDRITTNLGPGTLANMDPDDMLMIYEMDKKGFLTPEEHQKILDAYEGWEKDATLKGKMMPKHRNILERIKSNHSLGVYEGQTEPSERQLFGITREMLEEPSYSDDPNYSKDDWRPSP